MNPFNAPTIKNPFDDTGLAIAVNTVKGLPRAAVGVAKDIGQSIARSIGSTALTVARPFGGVDSLKASDLKNPFSQELFKSFFGETPVQPIEDRIAQAEIAIKRSPFAQKVGLDKAALPLAFGGVFGMTALDLTPFGALEKNAVKELVKETTEQGAKKLLTSMTVPDEIATKFAPHFAEARTPMEVEDIMDNLKGVLGVRSKALEAPITPKVDALAAEAQKYSSAEEFVKATEDLFTKRQNKAFNDPYLKIEYKPEETTLLKSLDQYLQSPETLAKYDKGLRDPQILTDFYNKVTSEVAPKAIPKSVQPIGEGASTIAKADQALARLPETLQKEVSSLENIVARRATEVKEKVNVIDYLRTPDRVLEKIGFANEAKLLRQGHEAYIKELPQNIDKITAWSKEVPKDASKTIFQYLDGENVALTDTERRVAGEVKDWLAEWAKRLDLPEDKTITNYITHIFDKELIAKEFDEDLAKIITDKIPGSVYDPFLLKRLGAKGYKQNVWEALDAYVKRATRKVNMDDALDAIQTKAGSSLEMSNIEASQFKYLQRYVSGVNMRPTELDNLLDNTIKNVVGYKYGQRPVTYLTKILRQMTYRGMLGLNPGSALRNISQGINTYAILGEKYTAIGYAKLLSPANIREAAEQGVFMPGFIQDRTLSSTKKAMEKLDKGLFAFFEGAERINRGAAYFGAKSKALAQSKSLEEAIDYAKSIVRKTQFSFGSIDTPVAVQSDIVKTLAQFQNYTIKQVEFLTEMVKDKNFVGLLRYGVAGVAFTYTIGKAFGMQPKDLIPSARLGTPPSLKLPVEVGKSVLNVPDKYGKPVSTGQKIKNIGASAVGLIPGGTQAKKSFQGLYAFNQGKDVTATGRTRYEIPQDLQHFLQAVLFGKSALPEAQAYYNDTDEPKASTKNPFNL